MVINRLSPSQQYNHLNPTIWDGLNLGLICLAVQPPCSSKGVKSGPSSQKTEKRREVETSERVKVPLNDEEEQRRV